MSQFRRIAIGEDSPNAVTVGIERAGEGQVKAAVWWPSRGDVDADEADYASVEEALAAAVAAKTLHGFDEVVVMVQSEELWRGEWGELSAVGNMLSDKESFELARALEASRDA